MLHCIPLVWQQFVMFDKAMLLLAAAFHSTWDTPTRRQSLRSRHPLRNVPFRCVLLASQLYNRVYCKFFIFCDPTVLHEIARRKKRAASFCHDFIKLKIVLKNKIKNLKSRRVASRRFTHINALRSIRNLLYIHKSYIMIRKVSEKEK